MEIVVIGIRHNKRRRNAASSRLGATTATATASTDTAATAASTATAAALLHGHPSSGAALHFGLV